MAKKNQNIKIEKEIPKAKVPEKQTQQINPEVIQPAEKIIESDSELYKSIKVKHEEPVKVKKEKLHFDNLERYYHRLLEHVRIKRIGNKLIYDDAKGAELPYYDTINKHVAEEYKKRGIIY